MAISDKIFYNQASAAKLGWDPSWFGARGFNDILINNIKNFQRENNLISDGLCGPATYTRAVTEREASYEVSGQAADGNYIIANDVAIPILWDKVVNLKEHGALGLPTGCYRSVTRKKRYPTMIVTHWDAALSAHSCFKILKKRNISSHFAIDNDGTIYQMVDTQHIGWHAGNTKVNNASIGIDFSNAYYMKYQNYYEKKGFGPRPVISDSRIHGVKLGDHLGYYDVQLAAYKALVKCLAEHYSIELACPLDEDSNMKQEVEISAARGNFKGIVSHYHLTNRKIDCAGLDINKLLREIEDGN